MTAIIPNLVSLPAPAGIFYFLLLLTLPLHLLMMNAMMGSSIISIYQHFRRGEQSRELSHLIAKFLPLTIAFTVNFGIAPFLFLQVLYGNYIYVSSIMMGAFWIAIYLLLIVAYYAGYLYDFKFQSLGRIAVWVLSLSVLLFLVIAFLFTNNMTLMLSPDKWIRFFSNSGGTLLNMDEGSLIPRLLHFILASVAVGGLFVALLGKMVTKKDPNLAEKAEKCGMKAFLVFTAIQMGIGIWFLLALPRDTMMVFMGGNMIATILFGLSLLLSLYLLHTAFKRKVYLTSILTVVVVYMMVVMRDFVRSSYLKEFVSLDKLVVQTELLPIILFGLFLVLGIATVFWMVRKALIALTTGS